MRIRARRRRRYPTRTSSTTSRGGHEAGANALAEEVAAALGATAVITTASEALGLPPLDLIGRRWGWKVEEGSRLTEVAAAAVRGEPIAFYQDAGRTDWWQEF